MKASTVKKLLLFIMQLDAENYMLVLEMGSPTKSVNAREIFYLIAKYVF